MAACAIESAAVPGNEWATRAGCVITVDGSYAARLARSGDSWFPERWTLDGPEPYAVPLPGNQPEEPGTEVLPLADGRVLIHRLVDGRHAFSLLYPTGPGTGEVPLGAVECPEPGTEMRLLPPAPGGTRAYALAVGRGSTAVWLVAGGAFGPEHLAEVPGRCSGGVWLGGGDRLLALDRELDGRTKTVVADLERGGELSPLLQISEESNDRLLLADADSGLLLIRSDAPSPGQERLGWGVLGSTLPVRFPECLHLAGCAVTPFAIQPGLVLTPESCGVALRIDGASGSWLGVWRPTERYVQQLAAPEGWLTGSGRWTKDGVLQLPYATGTVPCGVSRMEAPTGAGDAGPGDPDRTAEAPGEAPRGPSVTGPPEPVVARPVPLQQAPLTGRTVANAFAGRRLAQAATKGRAPDEATGAVAGEGPGGGHGGVPGGGYGGVPNQGAAPVGMQRADQAGTQDADQAGTQGADRAGTQGAGHTSTQDARRTSTQDARRVGTQVAGAGAAADAEAAGRFGAAGGAGAVGGTAAAAGAGAAGSTAPAAEPPIPVAANRSVASEDRSVAAPDRSAPAAGESMRRTFPAVAGISLPAAPLSMPPAAPAGVRPAVPGGLRPEGSEPVKPLCVEQVSTEAPPAFRTLRTTAGTTPSLTPPKVTTE